MAWPRPAFHITALAADHIIAQETSLVGSIGVLFQYPNVTISQPPESGWRRSSSLLKAAPNGFEPTSPRRAAIESIVSIQRRLVPQPGEESPGSSTMRRSSAWPTAACSPGVRVSPSSWSTSLGDERTALAWLAKEKKIDPDTPVREHRLRDRLGDLSFLHTAVVPRA